MDTVFRQPVLNRLIGLLLGGLFLMGPGCATLPNSGIDPSGERLFARNPLQGISNPFTSTPAPSATIYQESPTATAYPGTTPPGVTAPVQAGSIPSGTSPADIWTPPATVVPTPAPIAPRAETAPIHPDRALCDYPPFSWFAPLKPYAEYNPFEHCSLAQKPTAPTVPVTSGDTVSLFPTADTGSLPGGFGSVTPGSTTGSYTTTATSPNRTNGIMTAMLPEPDGVEAARPTQQVRGPALITTPREQIAPLGSEVVLISSFLGNDQRLRTNEPVEWSLDGVGHIFSIDPGHACDPLLLDFKRSKKHSDKFALTKTSSHEQTLTRGTADPRDDVRILRGQSWISVNATKEGTTSVTAVATNMKDWSHRSDGATIHWVDAEWVLPAQSVVPVGTSRTLTTTVRRRTNKTPRSHWVVRYEILGGPAAEFVVGDKRGQIIEIQTDAAGRADAELHQLDGQTGTTAIAIRIIRPASADGSDRALTLGNETFRQTWASGGTLTVRPEGPPNMKLGEEAVYRLVVTNNGTISTAAGVTLPVPAGMRYIRANIPPVAVANPLRWNTPNIAPRGAYVIEVTLKPEQRGRYDVNAQVVPLSVFGTVSPATTGPSATPYPGPPVDPASTVPTTSDGPRASVYPGSPPSTVPVVVKQVESKIEPVVLTQAAKDAYRTEYGVSVAAAYRISARNTSNVTLTNVRLALYAIDGDLAMMPALMGDPAGEIDKDRKGIFTTIATVTPGQTVTFEVGYGLGRPFSSRTLQGAVFVGDQVVDAPRLVINSP